MIARSFALLLGALAAGCELEIQPPVEHAISLPPGFHSTPLVQPAEEHLLDLSLG